MRGIHHCLGAPLARLEARVAFETLTERFADIRLTGQPPEFRPTIVLRGLKHLVVRVLPNSQVVANSGGNAELQLPTS